MKRYLNILLIGCLLALVSGCASQLKSDVVTFHEGPLPDGETIRVVPADEDKAGSLEFEHYAQLIRQHLAEVGYEPVSDDEQARLVARVDYSVSEGQTEVRSYPNTTGFARYHFHYGRFHDPFYYGFSDHWDPDIRSYQVFNRKLEIDIVETRPDGEVLFEGRVQSLGREAEIAEVMPYLVTAMFSNFPGESGVTKVVTIEKNP